jgi:type I site-specific restriction endonuclease
MEMVQLNFPTYSFSIREDAGQRAIFDPVRRKYVALTPEEWVRQHVIQYLLTEKNFPSGLTSVEGSIDLYKTRKRYDIAVFDRDTKPLLIVECKSPEVMLNQAVVDQIIRYNLVLEAPYLFITNGLAHLIFKKSKENYLQVTSIPCYQELDLFR